MPPANDNWASATAIDPDTASQPTSGSNVGATAETGEPANNGHTVWYAFTIPSGDISGATTDLLGNPWEIPIYFTTRAPAGAHAGPSFQTVLQAFTGSAVNALTEVTYDTFYSPNLTWKQRYANWDWGSYIVFSARPGTTYFIRVDGVNGQTGTFPLYWGLWFEPRTQKCSVCETEFDPGYSVCSPLASVTVTDVTNVGAAQAPNSQSFPFNSGASYAAGCYLITYCTGAFVYGLNNTGPVFSNFLAPLNAAGSVKGAWSVTYSPSDDGWPAITFSYDGGSSTGTFSRSGPGLTPAFGDYQHACDFFRGMDSGPFYHTGGAIAVVFEDNVVNDNVNAVSPQTNPSFQLWSFSAPPPGLTITSACAGWTGYGFPNPNASVTIEIFNPSPYGYEVTVTLESGGGVTAGGVTSVTLVPNGNTSATINFTASGPNVTAKFVISNQCWLENAEMPVGLAPVIVLQSISAPVQYTCGIPGFPPYRYDYTLTFQNIGNWSETGYPTEYNVISTLTCVDASFADSDCRATGSQAIGTFAGDCAGGTDTCKLSMSANQLSSVSATLTDPSGAVIGSFNFTLNVPA